MAQWKTLASDPGAKFDREEIFDADALEPMITYGTNPGMGIAINASVPVPANATINPMPKIKPKSPTRFTKNAFMLAAMAVGLL